MEVAQFACCVVHLYLTSSVGLYTAQEDKWFADNYETGVDGMNMPFG